MPTSKKWAGPKSWRLQQSRNKRDRQKKSFHFYFKIRHFRHRGLPTSTLRQEMCTAVHSGRNTWYFLRAPIFVNGIADYEASLCQRCRALWRCKRKLFANLFGQGLAWNCHHHHHFRQNFIDRPPFLVDGAPLVAGLTPALEVMADLLHYQFTYLAIFLGF